MTYKTVLLPFFLASLTFVVGSSVPFSFNTVSHAFAQVDNSTLPNSSLLGDQNLTGKPDLYPTAPPKHFLPGTRARKERIVNFVNKVTNPESPNYVPPGERIAVFDNDGTLWPKNPFHFRVFL